MRVAQRLSCCAVLFDDCARAWSWVIRAADRDESRRKTEYLQYIVVRGSRCTRPVGSAFYSLIVGLLSLSLPTTIAYPCPTYYYTILLYYIVNTLTMYLSLYCVVCCSLCLLVARSLARSALSTVPCVSLSSLGWVFVNFLTISLHC